MAVEPLRCDMARQVVHPFLRHAFAVGFVAFVGIGAVARAQRPTSEPTDVAVRMDPNADTLGKRRVSVDVDTTPLRAVVELIARQASLSPLYSKDVFSVPTLVSLHLHNVTALDAFTTVLRGTGISVAIFASGHAAFQRDAAASHVTQQGSGIVVGRVLDQNKLPIPNVRVAVVGTTLVVTTRTDGRFSFAGVPSGRRQLRATRLGYGPAEASVTAGDTAAAVTIVMKSLPTQLTDIVTTATGNQERVKVGNAIATIHADSVVQANDIRNIDDLLQDRVPGVQVLNVSGVVGAPSKIRMRGLSSTYLNDDPIVIVDGVRINAQTTPTTTYATNSNLNGSITIAGHAANSGSLAGQLAPSRLDDIDPSTIESIDVLRGPSAASLYGTDAANGVIVITTKKGKPGAFRLALSGDQGWSSVPGTMPDGWFSWGHPPQGGASTANPGCPLFGPTTQNGTPNNAAAGTCVQDSVTHFNPGNYGPMSTLGTGTQQNISGQLSGGTQQVVEFAGVHYGDQVGISRLSDVEQRQIAEFWGSPAPSWVVRPNTEADYDAKSSTSIQVLPSLATVLNVNGIYRNNLNDGASLGGTSFSGPYGPWDTLSYVPGEALRSKQTSAAKRGFGSANTTYNPTGWLNFRGNLGADYTLRNDTYQTYTTDCTVGLNIPGGCSNSRTDTRTETYLRSWDVGATATLPVSSWLSTRTSLGEQYSHTSVFNLSAGNVSGTNLPFGTTVLTNVIGTGNLYSVAEGTDESATAGWYLEELLSFSDQFYFTAGFRRDAGSAFGKDAPAPVYPKFSASWLVSQNPFFPFKAAITNFRLRGAYGHSGQQGSQQDKFGNFQINNAFLNGTSAQGLVMNAVGNPSLQPERDAELELGFDLDLWNSRVSISSQFYNKESQNAIITQQLPLSVGLTTNLNEAENVGSVRNRGLEFSVTAHVLDSPDFSWDLTFNATSNTNRLMQSSAAVKTLLNQIPNVRFVVGYPLYAYWARPVLGYSDANHDGILEPNEVAMGDSAAFVGAPYPASNFSYTSNFGLLHGLLRMSAMLDQVNGMVNATSLNAMTSRGEFDPTSSLAEQAAVYGALFNTNYFYSVASQLRLREVSVQYQLPVNFARRLHSKSATLTLAGRNLKLWTNYVGKDPMTDTGNLLSNITTDNGSGVPEPRSWLLRMNLEL